MVVSIPTYGVPTGVCRVILSQVSQPTLTLLLGVSGLSGSHLSRLPQELHTYRVAYFIGMEGGIYTP